MEIESETGGDEVSQRHSKSKEVNSKSAVDKLSHLPSSALWHPPEAIRTRPLHG